jgi:hypothetical protein
MGGGAAAASTRGTYGETNWKAEEEYREGVREFSDTGAAPSSARRGEGAASEAGAMEEEEDEGMGTGRGEAEEESEW